ncbi:MAG: RAMP superfamily CRISPR-associated protein [Desulfobacca sp.]|nr:RAMP superfamily CRISPR-associated protein [Desulfobacca sp.]
MTIKTIPPYQFIPVKKIEQADYFKKLVWHNAWPQPDTYTGEIRCSGYALTPLLIGNEQIEWKEYPDNDTKQQIKKVLPNKVADEHKIIHPFRFPKGKMGIPGSQIKGMLSQVIGALTSAPIERVNERTFSFRPNNQFPPRNLDHKKKPLPPLPGVGIFLGLINQQLPVLRIDIDLQRLRQCFCRQDIGTLLNQLGVQNSDYNRWLKWWNGNKSIDKAKITQWIKMFPSEDIPFDSGGGLDGLGIFARTFERFNINDLKRTMLITKKIMLDSISNDENYLTLSPAIYQLFELTKDHLKEDHINYHPQKSEIDTHKVAESIDKNRQLKIGSLIFLEYLERNGRREICSFGFNFRYRWRYRDSVKNFFEWQGGQWQPKIRPQFDLSRESEQKLEEARLSPRRRLLGFVKGEKAAAKKGYLESLAGRLSFSYAVHVSETGKEIGPVPLKILGSPKASSFEFYLTQEERDLNELGTLRDYGDSARLYDPDSVGEPRGRKFYLHQPLAASDQNCYKILPNADPGPGSKQSATALSLLVPDESKSVGMIFPHFKFTIRFENLEAHELGLLLLALDLGNDNQQVLKLVSQEAKPLQSDFYSEKGSLRAHKIGHGQPLGLGSFLIKIDRLEFLDIKEALPDLSINPQNQNKCRQALLDQFKAWFKRLPDTVDWTNLWSQAHFGDLDQVLRFRKPQEEHQILYPHKTDREGENCAIYNYHSDIRNEQLRRRRGSRKGELEALPPAVETWETPLSQTNCKPE